jgi:hypothetical protein
LRSQEKPFRTTAFLWLMTKKPIYTDTYTTISYNAYECVEKDKCGKERKYYKLEQDEDEYIDKYSKYIGRDYERVLGGVTGTGEGVDSGNGCSCEPISPIPPGLYNL